MRRILLGVAMLAAILATASTAEARNGHHGHHGHWGHHGHHHHHHGHGGWGGYRGYGWGGYRGYGWGGYRGYGWGGYGGYGWGGYGLSIGFARPFYNYGWNFGVPPYCYAPNYIYGGFNTPRYVGGPIGYYDYYGSTYNANSNFNSLALSPRPVASETTPAQVLNLLRLDRGNLIADLRADLQDRARALPRIGPLQETTIAVAGAPEPRPLVNRSNIAQRRKADQQVATGDMLFREQKFQAGLQRV